MKVENCLIDQTGQRFIVGDKIKLHIPTGVIPGKIKNITKTKITIDSTITNGYCDIRLKEIFKIEVMR